MCDRITCMTQHCDNVTGSCKSRTTVIIAKSNVTCNEPVARFTERLITYLSPKTYLTTHLRPKTCLILKICIKTCHKNIFNCKLNMAAMFTYMRKAPSISSALRRR